MIRAIFEKLNSRLWLKVMFPVCTLITLVMGISLWFNIKTQTRLGIDQLNARNQSLAKAVEGGMFDALATGDNDTVRAQFKRLGEKVDDLKVYVYSFDKTITFSTDPAAVGRPIDQYTPGNASLDIEDMMTRGQASHTSFVTRLGKSNYIAKNEPILNEQKCYHCHGKRNVLGGISVLSSMAQVQRKVALAKKTSILICVAGIAVIISLIWAIFFFLVNKKVGRVLTAAERLIQKDFTYTGHVKKGDEINLILSRLNQVTSELVGTIKQVIDNAKELVGASGNITRISNTLDTSSANSSDKASQVSAAAKQMNTANRAITNAMAEASVGLTAFTSAIEQMSLTVGEIAQNSSESKAVIENMVTGFDRILGAVNDLGGHADDVDAVTDEIRTISEQVSLLALNAKIEAARAGEAGKGFAVVAQEITELALDSNQATVKADEKLAAIKNMAGDLRKQVSGLAGDVKSSDRAIAGIAAAVEEQNISTQKIAQNINEVSEKINEVNEQVAQGAQAADEIAQSIAGVEEISAEVGKESRQLDDGAETLSKMAGHLSDLMKQFKV